MATAIAKSGRRKIRCRDSGAAELPSCATRKAARVAPERAEDERSRVAAHPRDADHRGDDGQQRHRPPPGGRVADGAPEVPRDRGRPTELRAAAADADVESACEDEVGQPERDAEHEHGRAGERRLADAVAPRDEHVQALAAEHQHAVRVRGDGQQRGRDPERPRAPPAAVERAQQREQAGEGEEEEEAVHAPVDAVEEEQPARRDDAPSRRSRRGRRRAASPSAATSGRLAIAKAAERSRRPPSPKPRWATAQARRKWSGAPPRSRVTCSTTPGSVSRPMKSASVSSSCGGHAISWWRRNAVAATTTPAIPSVGPARRASQDRADGARDDGRDALLTCLDPLRHRGFRHLRW